MKIALIFLVSCLLVAMTFGQNMFYGPFPQVGGHQAAPSSGRRSGGRYWPSYNYQKYEPELVN